MDIDPVLEQTAIGLLLPCPFCGEGTFQIRTHGRVWTGTLGMTEPTSYTVNHWCQPVKGQPHPPVISRAGRDLDSAVAAWNTRATGAVEGVR